MVVIGAPISVMPGIAGSDGTGPNPTPGVANAGDAPGTLAYLMPCAPRISQGPAQEQVRRLAAVPA